MSGDLGLTIKDLLLSKVICQSMSKDVCAVLVIVIGVCVGCRSSCNCEKKYAARWRDEEW